jgi:hypothetical protein
MEQVTNREGDHEMKYLCVWKPAKRGAFPPDPEHMAAMNALIGEMTKAGVLLATEGLRPSSSDDLRARRLGGEITITDGPFTEAKEMIGGIALLQVKSKEEAVEWTKRFLRVAGDGVSEVSVVFEG